MIAPPSQESPRSDQITPEEAIRCPACQHLTTASFPAGVDAPAQYGPRVQALAVYLSHFQLLPLERVREVLADLCQCQLSEGSLVNWIAEAAKTLEPTIQRLKTWLIASSLQHADETGIRIKGFLHWVHVNAIRWLTLYSWHRKRGPRRSIRSGSGHTFKAERCTTAGPATSATRARIVGVEHISYAIACM